MTRHRIFKYRRLQILNKSKASDKVIKNAIKFCMPEAIKNSKINIMFVDYDSYRKKLRETRLEGNLQLKQEYPFRGITITFGGNKAPTILITVLKTKGYNYRANKKIGYIRKVTKTPMEDLIMVLSHELKHVHQDKKKLPDSPLREKEADIYAMSRVVKFRKRGLKLKKCQPI